MQKTTDDLLKQDNYFVFIHTPLCGTCKMARMMLEKIESVHKETIFYEMNASLFPDYMQEARVESVPCLLIKQNGEIKEKVYAFQSTGNIYSYLLTYKPELFVT